MKSAIYETKEAADAAVFQINAALGYPKEEPSDFGPPAYTESYTQPIELEDGTWAVQMDDSIKEIAKIKQPTNHHDLATRRVAADKRREEAIKRLREAKAVEPEDGVLAGPPKKKVKK